MGKRFYVLYGGNGDVPTCCVEGVPNLVFRQDEDGLENKLVSAVKARYHCEAEQVGVPAKWIQTDLPDDYETCALCGFDHTYDSPIPEGPCSHVSDPKLGPRLTYPDLE